MKKQFGKLSKMKQEEIEAQYHDKTPQEFDNIMSQASIHTPDDVRVAREKEARLGAKLSEKPKRKRGTPLKRQLAK